jgi:hypothetical protein
MPFLGRQHRLRLGERSERASAKPMRSIERGAEARDRDRERQRHQAGESQRVELKLLLRCALEHEAQTKHEAAV